MTHALSRSLPVLALALALASPGAGARMYQWVGAGSAAVQLSGEPPPWYRSGQGGPRVRVFDNGNLVDDTAIALPAAQREALREAAFRESEQRQREEAVKRLEHAARQEQLQREEVARLEEARQAREAAPAATAARTGVAADSAVQPPLADGTLDDATVARLKAIISEFDRRGAGVPAR
jgi:hypothetical protein